MLSTWLIVVHLDFWKIIFVLFLILPTSKMELFAKIVNDWKPLTIFKKSSLRSLPGFWIDFVLRGEGWQVDCFIFQYFSTAALCVCMFYKSLCMFYFVWFVRYLIRMVIRRFEYCIIWSNGFLWLRFLMYLICSKIREEGKKNKKIENSQRKL